MKTMKDAKVGESSVVAKIHGSGALRRRIMDMGITRGTELTVVKEAPLGDPMEIELRGYHLSLRRRDAELVEVA
ncbi:MAG: ferrous iron transport protein A [Phoenicibacter congonensis]|uniref:Ferrous iron transport protein A n=1 Tax=Phoenicibacter congonensis TaxID=1944646 RepID=A0AA43UAR0_9ACTN|nr:ferrous iron transport protein A [Phoenicibacter congonensis]